MTRLDFAAIVPMLIVTISACAVLLAESFRRKDDWMPVGWFGVIGLGGALAASLYLGGSSFRGFEVIIVDRFTVFFNVTLCVIGLLTILLSDGSADRDKLPAGEYHALVLFSIVGMMLMGATRDLLVIFVALEIMSLGVYVLTGIKRQSAAGAEAAFTPVDMKPVTSVGAPS